MRDEPSVPSQCHSGCGSSLTAGLWSWKSASAKECASSCAHVSPVRGQYHATSCAPRFSFDLARGPGIKMAATDALRTTLPWVTHEADSGDPDASYKCVTMPCWKYRGGSFSSAGPGKGSAHKPRISQNTLQATMGTPESRKALLGAGSALPQPGLASAFATCIMTAGRRSEAGNSPNEAGLLPGIKTVWSSG
jgi:hypothetical protein